MADSVDIALASSNYQGSAPLGGGNFGAHVLDTRPLEDLGRYTMLYNKAEYDQRQKDAEMRAAALAEMTAYDPNSPIVKDRDYLHTKYQDFQSWVAENPDVLDYKNNHAGWLEYNKRKNELKNDIKAGGVRSTMYLAREEEIAAEKEPEEKARLRAALDAEVARTDIKTPLKHSNKWDVAPVNITGAPQRAIDVTVEGRDSRTQRKFKVVDMKAVNNTAIVLASGLLHGGIDKESEQYKNATPEEKQIFDEYEKAAKTSRRLEPVESSKIITDLIGQYKTEDGRIDVDRLVSDNSDNGIVMGVLQTVDAYNRRMQNYRDAIKNGYYTDQLGNRVVWSGMSGLNAADYRDININDGISPDELIKARILGASPADSYVTDVKDHNRGISQQRADTDAFRAAETKRHNIATEGTARMKAQAYVDNQRARLAQMRSSEEQDAMLESEWTTNLLQQPKLIIPTKDSKGNVIAGKVDNKLSFDSSIPIYTLNSKKDVEMLIPKGAKKKFDKNGKMIDFTGGHYDIHYVDRGSNRTLTGSDLQSAYGKFKQLVKQNNLDWNGSYDDYVKMQIENNAFDVRLVGENGSTTQKLHTAAQRVISNQNTKKGQASVFHMTNDAPDSESESSSQSSSTYNRESEKEEED